MRKCLPEYLLRNKQQLSVHCFLLWAYSKWRHLCDLQTQEHHRVVRCNWMWADQASCSEERKIIIGVLISWQLKMSQEEILLSLGTLSFIVQIFKFYKGCPRETSSWPTLGKYAEFMKNAFHHYLTPLPLALRHWKCRWSCVTGKLLHSWSCIVKFGPVMQIDGETAEMHISVGSIADFLSCFIFAWKTTYSHALKTSVIFLL